MKKCVIFLSLLVIILQIAGCGHSYSQNSVATNLVHRIQITCEGCDSFPRRVYTSPDKVRMILLCIRKLGPDFPAGTNVEAVDGKILTLTLSASDGSVTTYRIKNNQYLQKNDGTWRKINWESAAGFYQLILDIPSDEAQAVLSDSLQRGPERQVYFPALRRIHDAKKR